MDIAFTAYLWLNLILVGFFVGIGWILAGAVYSAILWVIGQRRPPTNP
jgi:uncharacterized membrane protein YedE/YeeE